MENKKVGLLVLGIAAIMLVIVLLFNNVVKESLSFTCDHGSTCGMYNGVQLQTYISLAIVAVIFLIGFFIMFSKPKEKIVVKKIKEKKKEKKINLEDLEKREKDAVKLLQENKGVMFQAELKEKLDVGKVGMTRLLDKLEAKQIIERKRRGMNNVVVLKD